MNIDLSKKVVVITGASKGIGSKLAKAFASEGAIVVMNYYHSESSAKIIYEEILTKSPCSLLIKADVTSPTEVSLFYSKVLDKLGKVDILINNAGICDDNLTNLMSFDQWNRVINTNLNGTFLCSREFSKIMIKQRYGKIINISSLKGQEGSLGQANYSASKAGIIGFTKSLAKELGKYNISVNAVCPGFIVTDLNRNNENKKEIAKLRSIISTEGILEDLKNFILYISSNKFSCSSGRVYNIDSRLV